jgi:hypothetical protein
MNRLGYLSSLPLLTAVLVGACSSDSASGDSKDSGDGDLIAGGDGDSYEGHPDGSSGDVGDGDGDRGEAGAGGEGTSDLPTELLPPDPKQPPAGELTAGMFDDNQSFSFFEVYKNRLYNQQLSGLLPFTWSEHQAANSSYAEAQRARQKLDITLIIDTTGSMGDEIGYLKREFSDLAATISAIYPQSEQRWGLVVYRDRGDEYLARAFDFTADLQEFQSILGDQDVNGGGDFPEAPEEGFKEANAMAWRTGNDTARLVFWVADAPHHEGRASALADEIRATQQKGIHIYPVASSGIDELTEFSMRSSAQLTHGRYIFLTDDSGLGGGHKEATVPCYYVTTLRDAILRGVATEMSGEYSAPDDDIVIRWGGRFAEGGGCLYGTGQEAFPF